MTADSPASTDLRADARNAFARNATGNPELQLERASMDAGFRSYWRADDRGTSIIVMDSPPDKEDVKPWLIIRDQLDNAGVRVPQVRARDIEGGFLLLEDLGTQTMLQAIDSLDVDTWFERAIDQLLKIQAMPVPAGLPSYDEELLSRELRLFDEWYLGRHLGLSPDCGTMESLDLVYRRLMDQILQQPRSVVHRDFMPRNLMPAGDELAVLDFQDAVHGPIAYDPLSLFKDAFISSPEQFSASHWQRYHQRALAAGLPIRADYNEFRKDLDYIGIQRHLKVMGIFARLCHRDSKPKYLTDAPRFVAYLDQAVPKYPELEPLQQVLDRLVKPSLAASV